jgi:hypothetical protein
MLLAIQHMKSSLRIRLPLPITVVRVKTFSFCSLCTLQCMNNVYNSPMQEQRIIFNNVTGMVRLEVNAHGSSHLVAFYKSCGFVCRYPNEKDIRNGFVDSTVSFGRSFWKGKSGSLSSSSSSSDNNNNNNNKMTITPRTKTFVPCADVRAVLSDIVDAVVLENISRFGSAQSRKRIALRFGSDEILTPRHVRKIPKGIKECPVLRGEFHWDIENYVCVWSGKWAISKEAFEKGECNTFRYVSNPTYRCLCCGKDYKGRRALLDHESRYPSHASSSSSSLVRFPVSGRYSGYFHLFTMSGDLTKDNNNNNKTICIEEKCLTIRFLESTLGWTMRGTGKNGWGSFELSGHLDRKTHVLNSEKTYLVPSTTTTTTNNINSKITKSSNACRNIAVHSLFKKTTGNVAKKNKNIQGNCNIIKLTRQRHFVDTQGNRYIVMRYI